MKAITNTIIVILVMANALPALISGWQMMSAPDGSKVFLDPAMLHGVFRSFLLPGIVLFFAIGIGSLTSIILLVTRNGFFPLSLFAEGVAVSAYVAVEIGVMNTFETVQWVYLGLGILVLVAGIWHLLRKRMPLVNPETFS